MDRSGESTPALPQENTYIPGSSHNTRQDEASFTEPRDNEMVMSTSYVPGQISQVNRSTTQSIGSMLDRSLPPGGPGGSLSWVSDKTRERDSFRRIRLNIGHTAPNSPLVPVDMNGWLTHRVEVVEDNIERMNRAIELRRMEKVSFFKANIQTALDGRRFGDFRSTVLAQTTIWRPDEVSNPSRPQAPWPDSGERKHEGYQRVRSGYSRFPPLPRVPGNPTVNWKQRSPIAAYELDKVGLPVILQEATTENDPNTESMIGESLLREIDA
ncbi:hypothetical protein TMatcc_000187 [Talaromyces marneffei ATCC 18224]|uniref:uncharacterized protein n=1 Tax=Talaromyces marneffei TaxID=37727 RepID=UPI0012A8F9FE|nr:uncharacterized protein EYB26_005264 [Talaromyces marneffei]KAE8549214.1 hypothetical protein EYB25_007729 [Talaromyces marneffei]QGA17593.1 hypothetical protein EYB26_005264 [Talaromyces marneffei]